MYFAVITEIAFPVSEGMLSLHAFCPDCLVVLVMHCFDFMNCASGYYDDCFLQFPIEVYNASAATPKSIVVCSLFLEIWQSIKLCEC